MKSNTNKGKRIQNKEKKNLFAVIKSNSSSFKFPSFDENKLESNSATNKTTQLPIDQDKQINSKVTQRTFSFNSIPFDGLVVPGFLNDKVTKDDPMGDHMKNYFTYEERQVYFLGRSAYSMKQTSTLSNDDIFFDS